MGASEICVECQHILDKSLTIIGAHVFLDEGVSNAGQEHNATSREYGFCLAPHELGRVLGLGSLVDGLDIMAQGGRFHLNATHENFHVPSCAFWISGDQSVQSKVTPLIMGSMT